MLRPLSGRTGWWLGCWLVGLATISACNPTAPETESAQAPPIPAETAPDLEPPATDPPPDVAETPADTKPSTSRPNPVSAEKQDCGQLATQADINQCAKANYEVSDRTLNEVYDALSYTLSPPTQAQLVAAEQAWVDFRDAQCEFERSRYEGGSVAPLILFSCLEQVTDERVAELRSPVGPTQSYSQADAQLNQVYQSLKQAMDASAWSGLQAAQIDWLAYRDTNCDYEDAATLIDKEDCLARMSEIRTEQLETLLEQWSL